MAIGYPEVYVAFFSMLSSRGIYVLSVWDVVSDQRFPILAED